MLAVARGSRRLHGITTLLLISAGASIRAHLMAVLHTVPAMFVWTPSDFAEHRISVDAYLMCLSCNMHVCKDQRLQAQAAGCLSSG